MEFLQCFIAIPILVFSSYNARICFQTMSIEITNVTFLSHILLLLYILGMVALVITCIFMLFAKNSIYNMVRSKDEGDVLWYYRKVGK
jgi:hypothetical protein